MKDLMELIAIAFLGAVVGATMTFVVLVNYPQWCGS